MKCITLNTSLTCMLLLAATCGRSYATTEPWTLVGIGDTQILVLSPAGAEVLDGMTQWIVEHRDEKNIVFVTQLGDLVTHGKQNTTSPNNQTEWNRINVAMSRLDGVVDWGVSVGNHEIDGVDDANGGFSAFKQHFGPKTTGRFAAMDSYRGASENDLNAYYIYDGGGRHYLHLHLELDVPDASIAWAQQVIDTHPGLPTIVSTHVFEGTQHGPPEHPYLAGDGRNSANDVWAKLINENDQIFMVLSGHVGQRTHQIRTNKAGHPVFTIAQDFAVLDFADTNASRGVHGENEGWIRLYEFDESAGVIRVRTYSPSLDQYLKDGANRFDLPLDFNERFGAAPVPEPATSMLLLVGGLALFSRSRVPRRR